jgi:hypothetical protein
MESFRGKVPTVINDGTWVLDFGRGAHIRFGGRQFALLGAAGERTNLALESVVQVKVALTGEVDSVDWTDAGMLSVHYVSGSTLEVPVDPDREAWTLTDSKGELAVAVPGGGVTTFPPR